MITNSTIDKIKESARVEEVVGDFVNLKRRGVNMIGLCPFHNEKTPSFTVSPAKGIYKCFGCGAAGDSVKFIMEHEQFTYPEALKELAGKYNIEIEETQATEEELAIRDHKESLFIITSFARDYFSDLLFNNDEGKTIGLAYFKERGFREDTIEKFQLGYTLSENDHFTKTAQEKGHQLELLKQTGLTKTNGNRNFDFFRERVQFPIHNLSGKVIAFAGRTLKKDKKIPKYINSPETDIYHKSKVLYGAYFAKTAIRKEDNVFMVEGYTDVISLHQEGIENVVASSGTSLTEDQIRLIKRFTPNITILYDGDAAGVKAALRGIDLVLEQGLNVRIVLLPEQEDPDSFIKKTGITGFKEYVDTHGKDFVFFKTSLLLEEAQNDPIKKAALINDIVETIARIPEPIKRSIYIRECSQLLNIDEQILTSETNKANRRRLKRQEKISETEDQALQQQYESIEAESQQTPQRTNVLELQESDILRILLSFGHKEMEDQQSIAAYIFSDMEGIEFDNEIYDRIIKEYQKKLEDKENIDDTTFLRHSDEAISGTAINLLTTPYELSDNWEHMYDIFVTRVEDNFLNDVKSSVNNFKLKKVTQLIQENKIKLKEAEDANDLEQLTTLIKVKMHLDSMKKDLAAFQKTVIT